MTFTLAFLGGNWVSKICFVARSVFILLRFDTDVRSYRTLETGPK
jgi:hypothetical protein